MRFVSPFALFWLLILIPLVALYFLRVQPRPYQVASLRIWQATIADTRPRRWWQRLRDPISLLISALIVLMLVIALANPVPLSWFRPPRMWVVVLDTSASMQADDVKPSRFASAIHRAGALVESAGPRDQFAVVLAGSAPTVACGLTQHRRTLFQTIQSIQASDAPANLSAAIRLGRRMLAGHDAAQLVVISDPGGKRSVTALQNRDTSRTDLDSDVQWMIVGGATGNVAISQFQARRNSNDPLSLSIMAELNNFSTTDVNLSWELHLDDELLDVIPIQLAAHGRWQETLDYVTADGGILQARFTRHDPLSIDNSAYAVLPQASRRRVLLVSPGNPYLRTVLESLPLVDLRTERQIPDQVAADRIVVLDRVAPSESDLRRFRNAILVDVVDGLPWPTGEILPTDVVSIQDDDSPLMQHVELQDIAISGMRDWSISGDVQPGSDLAGTDLAGTGPQRDVLAATADGVPVVVRYRDGHVRWLMMNLNLQRSELPLRTAFPLLMANAMQWLSDQTDRFQPTYRAGEMVWLSDALRQSFWRPASNVDEPIERPDQLDWRWLSPRGNSYEVSLPETTQWGPLQEVGLWRLTAVREASSDSEPNPVVEHSLAVNLSHTVESNLLDRAEVSAVASRAGWGRHQWWSYLVVAALLVSAVQWGLYHRRWLN